MVATPWGSSDSLRERRLRPGPGSDPAEVAQNQRQRIFGALVASAAERGYAATRLSDLVELSGVSLSSFYRHFRDKDACFLAAAEELLAGVEEATETGGPGSFEEQLRASLSAFAELVAAQPAAAQLLLLESFAAGPEVVAAIDGVVGGLQRRALKLAAESPQQAQLPPEVMEALIGAVQELARDRLRRRRETELADLMEVVAEVTLRYHPPPEPLRLATRAPRPAAEALEAPGNAERAIRALAVVSAERGYPQATVEEIVKRASMSPTTYYANFADKQDAMLAAIDSAGAQMAAAVLPAFRRNPDWPTAVRAAIGDLLSFLSSRPALARLVLIESYSAGPLALERREAALAPLTELLAEAHRRTVDAPLRSAEVVWTALLALIQQRLRTTGADSLPALAPVCTYLMLAPFIGAEAAGAAANGDGRVRQPSRGSAIETAYSNPVAGSVMEVLGPHEITPEEIALRLDEPVVAVEAAVGQLLDAGLVESVDGPQAGERIEGRFRSPSRGVISTEEWASVGPAARRRIQAQQLRLIEADNRRAVDAGTAARRDESTMARMSMVLDEEGWQEISAIVIDAVHAVLEARERSGARQRETGLGGFNAMATFTFFEMPSD